MIPTKSVTTPSRRETTGAQVHISSGFMGNNPKSLTLRPGYGKELGVGRNSWQVLNYFHKMYSGLGLTEKERMTSEPESSEGFFSSIKLATKEPPL